MLLLKEVVAEVGEEAVVVVVVEVVAVEAVVLTDRQETRKVAQRYVEVIKLALKIVKIQEKLWVELLEVYLVRLF